MLTTSRRVGAIGQLLEAGMMAQSPVRHLMWLIGLDVLLAADTGKKFKKRLIKFFGADAPALPPDLAGRKSRLSVGEVAEALWELRSTLAHGDSSTLTELKEVPPYDRPWPYMHILAESAHFLLTQAIVRMAQDPEQLVTLEREWLPRSVLKSMSTPPPQTAATHPPPSSVPPAE